MRKTLFKVLTISAFLATTSFVGFAQDPTPEPPAGGGMPVRPGGMGGASSTDPQPYERVITKDAKSKKGIFTVHQVKDKYYYEIPNNELGKEFLWVTQIAKTTVGVGYGGQSLGSRVVRWELNENNKVFLKNIDYSVVADSKTPIAEAVNNSNNQTIIMAFPVAAFGPNKESVVIDVTRLFSTDVFEFSARRRLNATALDASRTYIERISSFPTNIEAQATHTYTRVAPPGGAGGGMGGGMAGGSGMNPGSATVLLHFSMVKLPENPMMPRLFDERVGYFSRGLVDFGREDHRAVQRRFITRWRLEKKDPNAALSEPVKPIVYYIDSATPTKWIPFMKKGVEKWQKAFEAAGFKNAIIAKMAPTKKEDPEFDAEDARYSVIRWLPSTIENASGPHIHDPRTGEILESDIQFYHNVMNLSKAWYFVQVGPLDKRAQTLPLPDDLMGVLIEYVAAHEVGHTLGFQHNMKASSMYSIENVRNREWVKKMGHVSTLMDYSRFNYVAQPEDNIDVADLVPGIGPYDIWATKWGYAPIPTAKTPDEEKPTLDAWAKEQDKSPWLRFSTAGSSGSDFGELTEAVGDADAVKASTYGLMNLKRVAKMLFPATTTEKGASYSELTEMYPRMLGQWTLEMNHVAAIVGSYSSQQKHIGQDGVRFVLTPKARQTEAVKFLGENAFATPTWAIDKEILRRIEPVGALNRIRNSQNSVLNNLLSSQRFARLVEQQTLDGAAAYAPDEFLADVRNTVWSELNASNVVIDAYRRNLHRSYLDIANSKVNGSAASVPAGLPASFAAMFISSGDEKAYYRAELRALADSVNAALSKTSDRATKIHLEGVLDQIGKTLNPEKGSTSSSVNRAAIEFLLQMQNPTSCWHDYVIE